MSLPLRYAFSAINTNHEPNKTFIEMDVTLMTTVNSSNPQYYFKFTEVMNPDAAAIHENCEKFVFHKQLINLLILYRHLFVIRLIRPSNTSLFADPCILRFYVKSELVDQSFNNCNFSSITAIKNEQALKDFLRDCSYDYVVEPTNHFNFAVFGGTISPKRISIPKFFSESMKNISIPHLRCLTNEQINSAQNLLEITIRKNFFRKLSFDPQIYITESVCVNLNKLKIERKQNLDTEENDVISFYPSATFLKYTRGCGKRRTLLAFLSTFCSWKNDCNKNDLSRYKESTFFQTEYTKGDRYYAPNLTMVICSISAIKKWKLELERGFFEALKILFVETLQDFDVLTYKKCGEGGIIFITYEMLSESILEGAEQVNLVKILMEKHGCGKMENIDVDLCARFHSNNLGYRMPYSKVPITFIKMGCVVIEDPVEYFNLNLVKIKQFSHGYSKIVKSDWTFIMLPYSGPTSKFIPLEYLYAFENIINNGINEGNIKPVFNPSSVAHAWRIFHEPNAELITNLSFPKLFLKKVTIVSKQSEMHPEEKYFFEYIPKLHFAINANVELYEELFFNQNKACSLLMGLNVDETLGLQFDTLLGRVKNSLELKKVLELIKLFFANRKRGTFAQRLKHYHNLEEGTKDFANEEFLIDSLNNCEINPCIICGDVESERCLTMCGHLFCSECAQMSKLPNSPSAASGEPPFTKCPMCRSELSTYDWISIQKTLHNNEVPTQSSRFVPSKQKTICETLLSCLKKRRYKKRGSTSHQSLTSCWVIVPKEAKKITKHNLEEEGIRTVDMSLALQNPEEIENSVSDDGESVFAYILSFEEVILALKNGFFDNSVEFVVLSNPNISKDMYFEFIRASMQSNRLSPVQLHVLYTPEYEEVFSLYA
jgi:hypothetical protein